MPPNASPDITIFVGHRTMGRFYSLLVARFMIMRNGGGVLETPSLSLSPARSPPLSSLSPRFLSLPRRPLNSEDTSPAV